jgi:hypothetical protein
VASWRRGESSNERGGTLVVGADADAAADAADAARARARVLPLATVARSPLWGVTLHL